MKKLRFCLNKKLDEQMAKEFLDECGGGIDFGDGIVKIHPQLKSQTICVYFNNYYRIHKVAMRRNIERLRSAWHKREEKYRVLTEDLFGGFRFPQGQYIAYASIINCNPRFLESKTFQFFYKKPIADAIHTVAHELLHFIFFDFVEQKLKQEIRILSSEQLWDLSEIFNVVVLKSPRYRHLINQQFVVPYPDHRRYIPRFEKAYKDSRNTEEFIRRGMVIINAKK